jgi:hypothetical protein
VIGKRANLKMPQGFHGPQKGIEKEHEGWEGNTGTGTIRERERRKND